MAELTKVSNTPDINSAKGQQAAFTIFSGIVREKIWHSHGVFIYQPDCLDKDLRMLISRYNLRPRSTSPPDGAAGGASASSPPRRDLAGLPRPASSILQNQALRSVLQLLADMDGSEVMDEESGTTQGQGGLQLIKY